MLFDVEEGDVGNVLPGNQEFDNLDEKVFVLWSADNSFESGVKEDAGVSRFLLRS